MPVLIWCWLAVRFAREEGPQEGVFKGKLTLKKQFPCNPSAACCRSCRYSANYKIDGREFPQLSPPKGPPDSVQTSQSWPFGLPRHLLDSPQTPPAPTSALLGALPSKPKAPASAYFFSSRFSQAGEKTPNRHWLVEDRPGLMKSKASIRAQLLHAGTNEARRSPMLIPLHLTHFIDSPCFSNEMLNISPSAEARWQPLLWRWREWEQRAAHASPHQLKQGARVRTCSLVLN